MRALKSLAVFACAILAACESKFVDTLSKCSIHDGVCQGALITSSLRAIQKSGIPELGIPTLEPYRFQGIKVSILDLLELKAEEGVAKGLKDCVVDGVTTIIEKGHSQINVTCSNLVIKAKYKLTGSSPILKNLFGGESIHGDGNGKVKIEKIQVRFNYIYDVLKNKDGEPIFYCKSNIPIYEFEVLGKVSFAASQVMMGDQDITQLVTGFLNQDGKFVFTAFAKPFMDKAMEITYFETRKFFNVVPTWNYIKEDLTKYIRE